MLFELVINPEGKFVSQPLPPQKKRVHSFQYWRGWGPSVFTGLNLGPELILSRGKS
jgi:hypothetical protein